MESTRADNFLRMIRRSQRGRLKIYLGYCAGVGKTYQMLQEAHRMMLEGIDVVVGYVETHGRKETDALVAGLELVPRRSSRYKGIVIEEMDLGAVLARRPAVVLVDELAHTNVPGSKNAKRYKDVEDIRSAGIHVISTLNVQHLESLYDTVERSTGVRVRERIPDRVVLEADEIVNVDVTTEDLRKRLREGKVYTHERIDVALDSFFRDSNLAELRELTLREMASQIDSRRRDVDSDDAASSLDQIMVCLSSRGPNSEALLRYASRLAGRLNRNWYAVYVQTTAESPTQIDAQTQRVLANTLAIAQQLGATVFTYKGEDIVKTILQFAKEYRISHIVVGSPGGRPTWWRRMLGQVSPVEDLLYTARGINVVVLDTQSTAVEPPSRQANAEATSASPSASNKPLRLTDYVTDRRILLWSMPMSKNAVLKELAEVCSRDYPSLSLDAILRAIQDREAQGSTFLGLHTGIPHARVPGLDNPIVAIGIAPDGVSDEAVESVVRLVILLLSPVEPNDVHLRALALVAKVAGDDRLVESLVGARHAHEVMAILEASEYA
ncbi:MAG: hypothetical protein AMXMBFR84_13850 [Candidatus Hydrogenedentota bacterium]